MVTRAMTRQELKSLERDLLLIQRTRSELTEKVRKILAQVDSASSFCQTLELLIVDLRKRIDATPSIKKVRKKKRRK